VGVVAAALDPEPKAEQTVKPKNQRKKMYTNRKISAPKARQSILRRLYEK
jgi:hypothetical protein